MNTHNSQCVFPTFIHNGPLEHVLFYRPSGSQVRPPVTMLALKGGCDGRHHCDGQFLPCYLLCKKFLDLWHRAVLTTIRSDLLGSSLSSHCASETVATREPVPKHALAR